MTNPFRVLASLAVWAVLATLVAACGGGPGGPEGSSGDQAADTTPPTIVSKLPTDDQVNVDLKSKLVVTFSEALDPTTVTSTNVLLRRAGAGDVQREVTWDLPSRTVFIKPTTLLEISTQYKVTLTRGLKDKAGNELLRLEEWSFTTGDTIDYAPPVWRCSAVVKAAPFRFDAVTVSWGDEDSSMCSPGSLVPKTPATDNVTLPDRLVYIVWYKLKSESGFLTATSLPGKTWLEVTGLSPKEQYEFKVQVRDLADEVSDFRSFGSVDEGKTIYNGKGVCAPCHGATGKGDGPAGVALDPPPTDFTNPTFHASRTDAQLFAAIKDGIPGTGMISFNPALINDTETRQVIAYIRSLMDGSTVGSVAMPPAGRLYAANFLANAVSSIPDIGTVKGDRAGTQVFSANETGLSTPIGVAVSAGGLALVECDQSVPPECTTQSVPSMVYVSNWSANSITAYENPETLGDYPTRINAKPAWTITGLETGLAQPAALWVDTETDANNVIVGETLYVANMRGMSRTLFGEQPVGNILAFDVTRTVSYPTGAPQDPNGNSPPVGKIKSEWFRTPMAFAVDKAGHRLYVANRDKEYDSTGTGDQQGNVILAFPIPDGGLDGLMDNPVPAPYFIQGSCSVSVPSVPECALLGPTSIALDTDNDRLYVANRGQNNLVVIENASNAGGPHTTRVIKEELAGLVIADHPNPDLKNAFPNAVWFDLVRRGTAATSTTPAISDQRRLFVTTRNAQSVLIFNVSDAVMNPATPTTPIVEGQIDRTPIRVIRGSRTGLGQPTGQVGQQSAGPFGLTVTTVTTVVTDATTGTSTTSTASTAYVASFGLHAIPIFDVDPDKDAHKDAQNNDVPAAPPNTPPIRLLMSPMQGLTGAALDQENDRLYVAVYHTNLILVYDNASTQTAGPPRPLPDRIIGGPLTKLDHPVHLVFSPARAGHTAALFVANQSGHSVLVFGGESPGASALGVGDLNGNVAPSRVIGPPDGTVPFNLSANYTELAYPTGIALDELKDVLYVSNRDATAFEDFAGRTILAFANVFGVSGNAPPTWKIEGDPPPLSTYSGTSNPTDQTTLQRPAALYYDSVLDRLYVANRGRRTVLVFTGIRDRVLTTRPADHDVPPTWTITNAYLNAPTGLTGYAPSDGAGLSELYVADAGTNVVLAFKIDALDATDSTPTLTPRIIAGTSIGLFQPFGLALDPSR